MVIMTILMKIVGDGSPRGGAGLNPHEHSLFKKSAPLR